jgi:5-methyltetrahydropteroyltriglutamate--homocysteine methyltransferase
MGVNRDLKKATEAYWGGKLSQAELLSEAKRLRLEHWNIQKKAGVDIIPSNDFALYDQVLTHIQDFGVSCATSNHAIDQLGADSLMNRLHPSDIQMLVSTLLMNTLLWAVDIKRMVSMCLVWRW